MAPSRLARLFDLSLYASQLRAFPRCTVHRLGRQALHSASPDYVKREANKTHNLQPELKLLSIKKEGRVQPVGSATFGGAKKSVSPEL